MTNERKSNRGRGNKKAPSSSRSTKRSTSSKKGSESSGDEYIPEENGVNDDELSENDVREEIQRLSGEIEGDVNRYQQLSTGVLEDRDEYDGEAKAQMARQAPNPNVPSGGAFENDDEYDYTETEVNPRKLSNTASPAGREDERKGEIIPAPASVPADAEIWIEHPSQGKQRITKVAWENLKQGSTSGWKESSPEEPEEVTELKNKKSSQNAETGKDQKQKKR